jgi:hypothetical protein
VWNRRKRKSNSTRPLADVHRRAHQTELHI